MEHSEPLCAAAHHHRQAALGQLGVRSVGKRSRGGKRPKRFSVVAAVKRNAREQLGQPPPARVLPAKTSERAAQKHKVKLAALLAAQENAD